MTGRRLGRSGSARFLLVRALVFAAGVAISLGAPVPAAVAVTLVLDTTLNSKAPAYRACSVAPGDCSLRGAISKANADTGNTYTVQVPAGTYTLTITGVDESFNATGDLDILTDLTLEGHAADDKIIQAGTAEDNGIDRVLNTKPASGETVTISDVTIRFGRTQSLAGGAASLVRTTTRNWP